MVKSTLYTQDLIDKYVRKGHWTPELVADICDQNALKYPADGALVDSRLRLTWSKLKRQSDRIALSLLNFGLNKV